ncbi:hypothetical protein PO909_028634 [Leuciscus waleckii]
MSYSSNSAYLHQAEKDQIQILCNTQTSAKEQTAEKGRKFAGDRKRAERFGERKHPEGESAAPQPLRPVCPRTAGALQRFAPQD